MAFSIYDKLPKSPLPTSPFDFLAKLAEGHKQDLDKLDARIGETEGLLAKLAPAPGHEAFAKTVTDEYDRNLNALIDKFGNNPLSREFSRELTSLATSFVKDDRVRKITESKKFHDTHADALWSEQSKGSILLSPVLDENGEFIPNETLYSFDSFKLTSQANFVKSIQDQINIKRHQQLTESEAEVIGYNDDGTPIYKTTDIKTIWNDPANRKETYDAIEYMIYDNTNTDQGFRYLRALAEKSFPGDPDSQRAFIKETINNAGIPYDFKWTDEDETITGLRKGSGSGSDEDKGVIPIAVKTTVGKDYMVNAAGERIQTVDALEREVTAYASKMNDILSTDNLRNNISPLLVGDDGKLVPNALVTDDNGYQLINTELITDPVDKQVAEDANAQLMWYQGKQFSAKEIQARFMEDAGYDLIFDSQGKPVIYNQVPENVLQEAEARAFEKASYIAINTEAGLLELNKIGNKDVNVANYRNRFTAADMRLTRDGLYHELDGWVTAGAITRNQFNQFMNSFDNERDKVLLEIDPQYKKYNSDLTNYLNSTLYTNAYSYSISKDTERKRLVQMLGVAVLERDIQRSNFGPQAGDAAQILSEPEIETIVKDVLEKTKDENYDYGNSLSIRFDESRKEFVLDMTLSDGTYEIGGFAQQGLHEIVQQQDPNLSGVYLQKANSILTQLEATNGRYGLVDIPIRDDDNTLLSNDRIVVKTALKQHGAVAAVGDYLFCFPEYDNKVFVAKNTWALVNMTDLYREAKQAGKSYDEMKKIISDGMSMYSITAVPNIQENIGGKYFPTSGSRRSSIKVAPSELGK